MRTFLDCIPCFFKQALEAGRMAGASEEGQKEILDKVAGALPGFSLTLSPPEMARVIHGIVKKHTGVNDPYAEIKKKSNNLALDNYGKLKKKLQNSRDRLLTAVELAIAGNILDCGVKNSLNVDKELKKILAEEKRAIGTEKDRFFNYPQFKNALDKAKNVLYLADNAGETLFDRVFIEEIKIRDSSKNIIYAVKEKPAINDALAADAYFCGIDKSAQIVSSGSDVPATILSRCSKDFLKRFKKADLIISKGQGNFEALSAVAGPIFFLLMAKCPVIAGEIGCKEGDVILLSCASLIVSKKYGKD